jgi:hypoxanthine-guanine phosphoribosyltransferase
MKERKLEVLLAQETIATSVNQLAQAIDRDNQGGFPIVLGILTNSPIFTQDGTERIQPRHAILV